MSTSLPQLPSFLANPVCTGPGCLITYTDNMYALPYIADYQTLRFIYSKPEPINMSKPMDSELHDHLFSVARDLTNRKITSPEHLGIKGGSNGGLLVGVMFTQRPDLFSAVICSVPLLDMMRYHLLLAGASWVGEYGHPDDPV